MRPTTLDDDDVSAELSGAALSKADFDGGQTHVFTIARVDKKEFEAKNGRPAETRRVLTFDGGKVLTLNRVNLSLLAKWFGPRPSKWVGHLIEVYRDESVMFGGQLTGGWRLRRPGKGKATLAALVATPAGMVDDPDDEIPF
jgi:hypothetical protein